MLNFILLFIVFPALTLQKPMNKINKLEIHGVVDELSKDDEKYGNALKIAGEVFADVEKILLSKEFEEREGWYKDTTDKQDVVWAKDTKNGKMVTIRTVLALPAADVIKESWEGMETLPEWNENINFAHKIAAPTSHFDIVTYGNNNVLMVSGREFVSARIWRKVDDGFLLASRSVNATEFGYKSQYSKKVLANLHIAGAHFRPNPENPETTLADVVMLADLQGYIPKFVLNQVMPKIMIQDTVTNRKHFQDLKDQRDTK